MNAGDSDFQPKTAVQRAIALGEIDAFRAVPMEELFHIAAVAHEEWYPSGSVLFREGEPPGSLYVILEGRVRLERGGNSFGDAGPGEALGAWSLFDNHPRRATAAVAEDARVILLEREEFYEVLSEHVEITRSLVQDLVKRLMDLTGLPGETR
jgi:CRP-like cAMP-binding protein